MKLNINEEVLIKLTDKGRAIHRQWHENLIPGYTYTPPVENEHGYSVWQLWMVMQVFGKHLSNGFDIPFETEIILKPTSLT